MRQRSFGWLGVALTGACGVLAGVLLVVALGGAQGTTKTTTTRITVPANVVTTGGTVITQTLVPRVVGERLDVAKVRVARVGFDIDVDGGGLLGVIKDSNWEVVTQDPGPGVELEQGSSVRVHIERR